MAVLPSLPVRRFSRTFDEHLDRLHAVLNAIRSAVLSLKPEKCHFEFQQLKFLGHMVSPEGVSPDPDKTAAVSAFPTPADKRAVRRFLGLCAYYRRFVADCSKIAELLTRLIKDDVAFVWSPEQTNAFDELKARLESTHILGHFAKTPTPNFRPMRVTSVSVQS